MRAMRRGMAAAGVAVLALSGVAAACGDDDSATTTTIESTGGSGSSDSGSAATSPKAEEGDSTQSTADLSACEEIYSAGTATEGPDAIAGRSAPELQACRGNGELQIIDEVVGTGAEANPDSTVTVQYAGVLAADGEEFDSSWSRGEPATFPLSGVIEGWSKGLVGMKEGGRRTLIIPSDLAYGPQGRPGIPANSDLVFTVDLEQVG